MVAQNKDPLAWGRYVAVAGAYAACYELTRNFSFSHWMLPAGLRLACLLLVPRRFWPALAVGETIPVAEMAAMHVHAWGVAWALVVSIPTIMLYMPFIALLQRFMSLRRADGQINMAFIMVATMAGAIISAANNSAALSLIVMADGSAPPPPTLALFLAWLLGAYLGALTLTPVIMALRERIAAQPAGHITWRAVRDSTLARDAVLMATPLLGALMFAASETSDSTLQCVRFAMAVPVLVMTWRHGWHGTAIGGMLASIAMASTSFTLRDPAMIQAQVVLAFAISTSLIFGVRVARRIAVDTARTVRVTPAGHSHR